MTKLWKVTVNTWGWHQTRTLFATSRESALELSEKFPAADAVEYAGRYSESKAKELLEATETVMFAHRSA